MTIPDGQSSAGITVTPINNGTVTDGQTVQLNLVGGPGYTVGSRTQGLVMIVNAVPAGPPGEHHLGRLVVPRLVGLRPVADVHRDGRLDDPGGPVPTGTASLLDGTTVSPPRRLTARAWRRSRSARWRSAATRSARPTRATPSPREHSAAFAQQVNQDFDRRRSPPVPPTTARPAGHAHRDGRRRSPGTGVPTGLGDIHGRYDDARRRHPWTTGSPR